MDGCPSFVWGRLASAIVAAIARLRGRVRGCLLFWSAASQIDRRAALEARGVPARILGAAAADPLRINAADMGGRGRGDLVGGGMESAFVECLLARGGGRRRTCALSVGFF